MRLIITVTAHSPSELFYFSLNYHDHLPFLWSLSSLRRFSFMLVEIREVRFDSSGWSERSVESIWSSIIQMMFFPWRHRNTSYFFIIHVFQLRKRRDLRKSSAKDKFIFLSAQTMRSIYPIPFLSIDFSTICLFYNASYVHRIRQHLSKYVFIPTYYFLIYVEYVSFRLGWQ